MDYLLKPFDEKRVRHTLERVRNRLAEVAAGSSLPASVTSSFCSSSSAISASPPLKKERSVLRPTPLKGSQIAELWKTCSNCWTQNFFGARTVPLSSISIAFRKSCRGLSPAINYAWTIAVTQRFPSVVVKRSACENYSIFKRLLIVALEVDLLAVPAQFLKLPSIGRYHFVQAANICLHRRCIATPRTNRRMLL